MDRGHDQHNPSPTLIIGAGMSGLRAATALHARGVPVTVVDKGRGAGGRLASRRIVQGALERGTFDHGAQFFTAKHPAFARQVQEWVEAGVVAPWRGCVLRRDRDAPVFETAHPRYVGTPRMSAVSAHLASLLPDVRAGVQITSLRRDARGAWVAQDAAGAVLGRWAQVILALPAPQAATLLRADAPTLATRLDAVEMAPCWALMIELSRPLHTPFDAVHLDDGGALSWIARDSSKPGRSVAHRWVAHASVAWSQAHLEDDRDEVAQALTEHFARTLRRELPRPRLVQAHRWRFARATCTAQAPFLLDRALGLGLCGDWCLGARVEAAWLSGDALAQALCDGAAGEDDHTTRAAG